MRVLENLNFHKAWTELMPKLMGQAIRIVLLVSIVSFVLAIVFGFILALGRLSKHKVLSGIIVAFQELIRGTPLLVQLVYIYYVFPLFIEIIAYFFGIPDYKCTLSAVTAGIIGMTINYVPIYQKLSVPQFYQLTKVRQKLHLLWDFRQNKQCFVL